MLCLLAAASSSWAYTTDAQTHAVVTADGTTLTAGAQAWIKAYSQAVEQRWSAGGGSAGDITAFKKMLLWRFLPPAGSVLPMAAGTSTQSQVCSPAIQAGCWYYQRDDHGINAGSQGGHFIDWTYYGPPYYGTFPSTNNLDGFTFPDLSGLRDLFVARWDSNAHAIIFNETQDPSCSRSWSWNLAGTKPHHSWDTRNEGCFVGYGKPLAPAWRGAAWTPAFPDTLRPQANDPNVPNSPYCCNAVPYDSQWAQKIAQDLQQPANADVRNWIAHDINPGVDSPYHAQSDGLYPSDLFGLSSQFQPNLPHPCGGDPVTCATGNFTERYTDLRVGGLGTGLVLSRTYNAQDAVYASAPGPLGYGWSGSFRERLETDPASGAVTVHHDDGATAWFRKKADGSYSANGWVQSTLTKNGDGSYTYVMPDQRSLGFDSGGRLVSESDRNANKTTLAYDTQGNLASVTDPTGRTLTLTNNADGTLATATDPAGNRATFSYSGGNLTSVTDPRGGATIFAYDASHRITSVTDPRGGTLTNVYDSFNRVTSQTDPANRQTRWAYSPGDTQITDPVGNVTDEHFAHNLPTSITRGKGTATEATTTYAYDATFNPTTVTDPDGHAWQYGYDGSGNRTSVTDPLSRAATYAFDARHDPTSIVTPAGHETDFAYDSHSNLTSVTRTLTETNTQLRTTYAYNSLGELTSTTDPLNHSWTYGYDGQGDRASATSPLGHKTTWGFDVDSRVGSVTSARGNEPGANASAYTTSIARDQLGYPTMVIDASGHATTLAYDGDHNLTDRTDRDGRHTEYTFNADNELTTVTRPDGSTQSSGYDSAGRLASQTDGLGHATAYGYDPQGRVTSMTDPLNRATAYGYDAAGNRTSVTDPQGRIATYGYDAANQPTSVGYSSGSPANVTFAYNADGQRTASSDSSGNTTYSYDSIGRLTGQTNGAGQTTGYGYDNASELTSIVYPPALTPLNVSGGGTQQQVATGTVTRAYDSDGNLATVTDWLNNSTQFSYDAEGELTGQSRPNGTTAADSYDANQNLSALTDLGNTTNYTRSNEGLLTGASPQGGQAQTYGYDSVARLTGVGANNSAFGYDTGDNPTTSSVGSAPSVAQAFDAANQLTSTGQGTGAQRTFAYDPQGNRTTVTDAANNQTSLTYDQADQLANYASGSVSAQYVYDADGLRQTKTVNNTLTNAAYDLSGSLPLQIEDGPNAYLTGPGGLPIEQIAPGGTVLYYSHDQQGSTTALTDQSGSTAATYSYDPYGNPTGATGTATTPFGYEGQYTDPETGLQYLRARYYDPTTAQFINRDPIEARTRQPYGYAGQSPTNYGDPSGKASAAAIAGAADTTCAGTWEIPVVDAATCGAAAVATGVAAGMAIYNATSGDHADSESTSTRESTPANPPPPCGPEGPVGQEQQSASGEAAGGDQAATPEGRPLSDHYLYETGPVRNIPGSVVDEAIDHGQVAEDLPDRTVYYDPKNDVTAVVSKTTGKIMSARRGVP
ncbi:MAG: RHS repeat-associated core domain-containing protein [Actinobacteria bacterium]|nr:MAG: RHS repeat-associated core domain-containing protein [Actinomycetota bacterium]